MLMIEPILSEGKEYISAIRASKKIGYASDYIGQLCRAKKIPGKLIGKTWYVDFASLLEHRRTRRLGKKKKVVSESTPAISERKSSITELDTIFIPSKTKAPDIAHKIFSSTGSLQVKNISKSLPELIISKSLNNVEITYEKEQMSRLPELSKKSRYVEPIWNKRRVKRAAVLSLGLLIAMGTSFATLERTSPTVALGIQEKIEETLTTGRNFIAALPTGLVQSKELVATSIFTSANKFFENVIAAFGRLKEIALSRIFIRTVVTEEVRKADIVAVTNVTNTFNPDAIKAELKTELENFILKHIGAASSPIIINYSNYSSDLQSFKNNEVVPAIYYSVTNQSNSDVDHLSSAITNLLDGSTFTNTTISGPTASFTTVCLNGDCQSSWPSGGSGTFSWTPTSYGVATSTTLGFLNGFLSTASSTIDGNLTITGNATATNATTTNFFSTNASTTNFYGADLATCQSNNVLTWSGGRFGCEADDNSSAGASDTFWATTTGAYLGITPNGGLNVNVGLGTTTPVYTLTVASSSGPQLS